MSGISRSSEKRTTIWFRKGQGGVVSVVVYLTCCVRMCHIKRMLQVDGAKHGLPSLTDDFNLRPVHIITTREREIYIKMCKVIVLY